MRQRGAFAFEWNEINTAESFQVPFVHYGQRHNIFLMGFMYFKMFCRHFIQYNITFKGNLHVGKHCHLRWI